MNINKSIRNIGVLAHVDAGKTTLTEQILYLCESIREIGRVDDGTAHTDKMDIERERGISIQATSASVLYKNVKINIIDTPGHVDFTGEVERALLALDGAILVISAKEGVQSHTEVIYKALKARNIPTIIFVNKIDRLGVDINLVNEQLRALTENKSLPLQGVIIENLQCPILHPITHDSVLEEVCLKLSEYNETILEQYLNQAIQLEEINQTIKHHCQLSQIHPVLYGSALRGLGVREVLDGIIHFLPEPHIEGKTEVVGVAYKINKTPKGKLVFMRLFEGLIKIKDYIYNDTLNIEEKVDMIFRFNGCEYEGVDYLSAGEIGILCGLTQTKIGNVFGYSKRFNNVSLVSPMLTVRVYPKVSRELERLVKVLNILEEEDPLLNVSWKQDEQELHVDLMGTVQMEVLTRIIEKRFNLGVIFEKPTVVYKETPLGIGVGEVNLHTPYFGRIQLQVEPLPRGSGVIYESNYTVDFVFPRYQNEVEASVPSVLKEGIYGWELTDIKVTLIGGRSVKLATQPGDFKALTPIALMEAIKDAKTTLLEPVLSFELNFNQDEASKVYQDLFFMRAEIAEQNIVDDYYVIKGTIPVATSLDYAKEVMSLSKGRSQFKSKFKGYQPCTLEQGKIRLRKTVDPSDKETYLFSMLSNYKQNRTSTT